VGILAFLGMISAVASWLPARRAGRIEPAIVLRGDWLSVCALEGSSRRRE